MAATYALITVVMGLLAWRYNTFIEGEGALIPTSFKVTIGVAGTEIFRVARIILLVLLAWPVIAPHVAFGKVEAILGVIAFWTADVLLGYGPTGGPMIHGDLCRMRLERAQETAGGDESIARAKRDIEEAAEAAGVRCT